MVSHVLEGGKPLSCRVQFTHLVMLCHHIYLGFIRFVVISQIRNVLPSHSRHLCFWNFTLFSFLSWVTGLAQFIQCDTNENVMSVFKKWKFYYLFFVILSFLLLLDVVVVSPCVSSLPCAVVLVIGVSSCTSSSSGSHSDIQTYVRK